MPNTYGIIGVLVLMLTGAVYSTYHQTMEVGRLNAELAEVTTKLEAAHTQAAKNAEKTNGYYSKIQELEAESLRNREKAAKDITRVENISRKRATLYTNLVNKDYDKLLNELAEVSK